ncbi:hypothetical protein F4821DRAFT_134174 [Hypoxylon rubiginosum]|uniref:Uncharacterized protein n=1 Tax=Hypoxylon rubiginosum TaxID=110542 RepID=A0ACC0DI11_9PEZI|nr:hypothetical protein F4821DRAFT_134174 [Hypoxylon rubiginosum]
MDRSISTRSTASIWTERTLASMGLSTENLNSNAIEASRDDVESTPLRHWKRPEQKLDKHSEGDADTARRPQHIRADPKSSPATKKMSLAHIWWLEILSGILVIAMVAALVGTVYPYQDQPLPHWPYTLSINTIVAFYSEVMRAAMILVLSACLSQLKWSWFTQPRPLVHVEYFDNASRGPWGSLELLWAIRLRAILPSIGAFIMILTLLLVPFTQQIVRFYSCTVLDPTSSASIPKSNIATAGASLHIGAGISSISPEAQGVINSGIYDSSLQSVSFICPTGNCTFDGVYHSMGWCSHCADVSDQIEISRSPYMTNFTLPSSNLTATVGARTFVMNTSGGLTGVIQAILGWANGSDPLSNPLSDTPWGKRGYGAAECKIDPCIRSYTGSVEATNLTETLVATKTITWGEDDNGGWASFIDVSCLNNSEQKTLRDAGYIFDPDKTAWITHNISGTTQDPSNPTTLNSTNTTIRSECIYQVFYTERFSLNEFFMTLLSGTVGFGPNALSGAPIVQFFFREGKVTFSSIDDTFDHLAQALTVYNRERGGNVTTGHVYRGDTCVSVRWAWLAYPLCLVLGMMVLLVLTIDYTRRNEGSAQDYKSSPLALLFHRIGGVGSEGPAHSIESSGKLQETAKTMRAVFQSTDKIWRFIEVESLRDPETSGR